MSTRPRQLLSIILSYNAPENGDQHARRYKAILKQTKDLFENQVIQRISQNTVSQAFQNLRQLLLHPPGVFDVHSATAAFEHYFILQRS